VELIIAASARQHHPTSERFADASIHADEARQETHMDAKSIRPFTPLGSEPVQWVFFKVMDRG
jgi:hypothetical protein